LILQKRANPKKKKLGQPDWRMQMSRLQAVVLLMLVPQCSCIPVDFFGLQEALLVRVSILSLIFFFRVS